MNKNQRKKEKIEKNFILDDDLVLFKDLVKQGYDAKYLVKQAINPDHYLFKHEFSKEKRIDKRLVEWVKLHSDNV
jgi:hypothetical protein